MRDILGLGRILGAASPRTSRGAGGAFRLPDATPEAGAAATASGVTPLGVLAVQESDDPRARDRRGAARATALLADLDGLQAELLGGAADAERLTRLARLAEGEAPADPILAEAVDAIALRAKVELAKRGLLL